jgi:hypothetical protein
MVSVVLRKHSPKRSQGRSKAASEPNNCKQFGKILYYLIGDEHAGAARNWAPLRFGLEHIFYLYAYSGEKAAILMNKTVNQLFYYHLIGCRI